jgi:hypothetical protein
VTHGGEDPVEAVTAMLAGWRDGWRVGGTAGTALVGEMPPAGERTGVVVGG